MAIVPDITCLWSTPQAIFGGGSLVGLCHEDLLEENTLQKLNFLLVE
jgi:hypothetical protein